MVSVYWFGYGGNAKTAEELRPIIESLGMSLTTIHEHENANIKWERTTWLSYLQKADIIIVPANFETQSAKSQNRVTQALSLGKPVIVSPLPAYLKVLEKYPDSFLIAKTQEEWKEKLILLRDNEELRKSLSEKALVAAKEYSIDSISNKWLDLFKQVEKIDVIIPTYKNPECLKLCIDSIRNSHCNHNIIVVNNGDDQETQDFLSSRADIIHVKVGKCNFSQAVNIGLKHSKSPYICILNDDTIVSEDWVNFELLKNKEIGLVGPLSNCDFGWLHNYQIAITRANFPDASNPNSITITYLKPGVHSIPEIKPLIKGIYKYQSPYNELKEQKWIAFYCVMMRREILEKVGFLDESFTNSGEDVDYCYRIGKLGYKIVQNYNSFVFHFGAVGRKILESEDKEKYQAEQKNTNLYLNEKWNKENIVIYTGPSWERWDYRNLNNGGIGGSETWAIWLAREFDKLGYRVKVFADCENDIKDGNIDYLHYSKYPKYIEQNWIDYFISSRTTDTFDFPIRAKKKYVMIHDIWLLSQREKLHLDKVDKFCVLSDWHKDFVKDYHQIPEDKLWMTANGVDPKRFEKKVERIPNRLIYSSSPDRGLDTLLYLFPFIKKEIPTLTLKILYGFENWEKAIKARNNEDELKRMNRIKEMMNQDGVIYGGRINQEQLAEEFLKSSLFAYPTDFEETHCISAVEAQSAGLPVIASNYAGLRTTVGDSGILLGNGAKEQSYTKEYRIEFVNNVIELLKDQEKWNYWSEKSLVNAKERTWENVAKKWIKKFS